MYKQTLCVTLPISAAVIIAAALFANAGDLDPPPGNIKPTMNTLEEIYNLVQQSSPCGGCTWEYVSVDVAPGQDVLAVQGSGVLHGVWFGRGGSGNARLEVWNGIPEDDDRIGAFRAWTGQSHFFQLDVTFENSLYLGGGDGVQVTILYRTTE